MNHQVFISYSSKNKNAATAICHILEDHGLKCWMAPRDIPAGSQYGDLIDSAIKQASVVVVVFSQNAVESQWVNGELNIAFEEQKVIIPYRIDTTPFSGQSRVILNQKHWIDAYPDFQTKFNDLIEAVTLALGQQVDNPVQKESEQPVRERKLVGKKVVLFLVAIFMMAIAFFISKIMDSGRTPFHYHKAGIKIESIKGLSNAQQEALRSILDNMVFVEGGRFNMGVVFEDYVTERDISIGNSHQVELAPFYISKFEVTQAQWKAFAPMAGCCQDVGDDKAVDYISWEEAKSFADSLAAMTGLKFSLPTEAQWEYAAGDALSEPKYPFAGFEEGMHHYAWTMADNLTSAEEVGKKSPNKLGLYDMTGNVSEWCLDDFAPYSEQFAENPLVLIGNGKKIYRGGDYGTSNMMDMKITSRSFAPFFAKRAATGLRLVLNQ